MKLCGVPDGSGPWAVLIKIEGASVGAHIVVPYIPTAAIVFYTQCSIGTMQALYSPCGQLMMMSLSLKGWLPVQVLQRG